MGTTVRYSIDRGGVKTVRYVQGWRDPEQDRRPPPRVARIISQEYDVIKRECLKQQALWEDPSFPTNDQSIFPSSAQPLPFTWKRPGELCSDPRMFVDGFARFDVVQGGLGNCWFLAAVASLCVTQDRDLFHNVIPLDNLFVKDYTGTFHFRIWQYGKWVDVVVDDRLPTVFGDLVFVHSATHNEFWPALLEKAYAKLNGSYEALQGGTAAEAMEDFTGGLTETFDLNKPLPKDMFTIMKKAFERKSLMGCTIDPDQSLGQTIEGRLPNGLITGHAYSITAVRQFQVRGQSVNLLRIRNPWGNEAEWRGAWGDRSPEWKYISDKDKQNLGLTFEDDGEFWMSFEDFIANFTKLEVCMVTPAYESVQSLGAHQAHRTWKQISHEGSWKRGVNAGGCSNNKATFWTNPQYRVEVVDPDEEDDDKTGTLVVALMQKERRKKKQQEGIDLLFIGYAIYKIDDKTAGPLDATFFRYNLSVARSPQFSNVREMVGRHKLAPGPYVVIPCTFKANEEGDFLLRIFSENKATLSEMDEETDFIDNKFVKVKDDVPIFHNLNGPGSSVIKGHMPADSEKLRERSSAVTGSDVDEEREMRELFKSVAGVDLEVDAYELRAILDANFKAEFGFEGVNLETSRSMVAMMDVDHSGKLGYEEFKKLWIDLRRWKKVFKEYDRNKTCTLDSFELRAALNSAGFRVSNQTFKCLVMRYSDQSGQLHFDDFVLCAVRLKSMFETFRANATDDNKPAQFLLDEFIQTTMYS